MKRNLIAICSIVSTLGFSSCANQKNTPSVNHKTAEMEITGVISKIENGKDGYMAIVQEKNKKNYVVTISSINLQKSGVPYKKFNVGDTIRAKGTYWKDEAGTVFITANNVNELTNKK